ncbi:Major facilitator superfamily MFS_1 OS=Tsukamurella paurometabola (strain ATCC 8368 / DSM /CCUG 35730 / CIP 100753 / JCM 10117 / KCTC 9821 / NBRC 16120/ NCIMB 702349 / NCTC 13040) OX=521096 GN=Tpau_0844 PE=4 SV=1 [Tsukamurella paurometabola]|uniref:Major facilitator superfamily MFS_1 n=1 Tax=Tsukamurella paurometabola (strain ATCC 8368 / DSM 20162 / CCUG 35730 / CIP 100753 / JCM 10117 / KCTC 9821 / NBRC 16120 / NCIMB 702349 / NCTC 13040) TaxID=521096 RepID=D5UTX5_TSUPD|nr:MFS transporter [Tsukamurella paurometabola]ADG77479.1 major facilitator superfamily MFS_1 [Tsukamurella paurometabola DSM 20162]SUP27322.1 enterobactin exporter EntS [Tsukamurella paurometabola]
MPSVFVSLRTRNYRLWAGGQSVSLVGTWMQRVAEDWLVLDLAHGRAWVLGVVMALQFGPTLLLSAWAGLLADRYDKRRVLMLTQSAAALCAAALAVLTLSGIVALWHVFVIAFVFGCTAAIAGPFRQAFTIEMVGPELLPNAIGLNSMVFNAARIVGPAIAGLLIAGVGTGAVFAVNAVFTGAIVAALLAMRVAQLHPSPPVERAKGQVREGFRYVRHRPELLLVIVAVFFVSTFGINFPLALSILARQGFGLGADAYGLLSTMLAIGTLSGALVAAKRTGRAALRTCLVGGTAFGVVQVCTGLAPWFWLAAALLIAVGFLQMAFTTSAMSIMQLSVDPEFRGRVMGIYMLAFLGGTPLGAPLLGAIADATTPTAPLLVGGVVSALTCALCGMYALRGSRNSV